MSRQRVASICTWLINRMLSTLAGYSYNAQSLGEEPMDVSERVDIFLEHQHDAFFVIPLELWNGK